MTDINTKIHEGEICERLLALDEFTEYQSMLQERHNKKSRAFDMAEKTVALEDARTRGILSNMRETLNLPSEKVKQGRIEKDRLSKAKP